MGGQDWGELPVIGLDKKGPSFGYVLGNVVTVLQAVAELSQGVHMAKKCWPGAQGFPGFEILLFLCASISVELNDGYGV